MEDWNEIDEYENRYADELEMMEDMDAGPPSKRSLKFNDEQKHGEVQQSVAANESESLHEIIPAKKRDCHDMYSALSDDDSEEELDNIVKEISVPSAKRARLSPSRENKSSSGGSRSTVTKSCSNQGFKQTNWGQRGTTRVFKRPPMSCESVTITRTDGQRLFIPIRQNKWEEGSRHGQRRNARSSLQLLSVPFSVLKQHVEDQRRRKAIEESERITAALQSVLNEDPESIDELSQLETADNSQGELWVEKYTPKHFTELLSDDAINRTLLKWLKLWDKVVFHKDKQQTSLRSVKQDKAGRNKKQAKNALEDEKWIELDANGYPAHKVALLCGPPGLGKTTLAHVIARHAGYNVVEMNASDDRSAEVFRNKIESSTQMKSVLGADERPNCLVIDEIDGAPTPAINVLLSIVKHKDSDPVPSKTMTKKKKSRPLSRPIICICNDQYVASLRQLRQVAFVVPFPTTIPGRLANRLQEVSRKECVSTDMTTLLALSEKADNDIRSCLNTLQFVHKHHGRVVLEQIQSMDIGQKDAHRSLFSVWQEIFQLPKPKRRRFAATTGNEAARNGVGDNGFLPMLNAGVGSTDKQGMSNTASRFHTILHSATSAGEYDKIAQGLFENYLQVKFKDPSFELVVSGTEWLEFSDFVERHVIESQNFMLRRYSPFLSVVFHLLFASPAHSKLSYPSSQYESRQKQARIVNLVDSLKSESSPRIRQNIDIRMVSLELFPLLLEVITPTLRPVNTQLFSAREKQQMAELIDTMIAYNLTYHQERNPEGQYTYILDPNIEEVVKFPGQPQHKQLTYASKQMIAREIDLEKMRRAERMLTAHNRPADQDSRRNQKDEKKTKKALVLNLDTSKAVVKKTKPALDFFGRPIQSKSKVQDGSTENQAVQSQASVIWFRFKEGFSNAVRKTVKIQDFL